MKNSIQRLLFWIASHKFLWTVISMSFYPILKMYQYRLSLDKINRSKVNNLKVDALDSGVILNGIFFGMKYPPMFKERTYYSKILGSYEMELHPVLSGLKGNNYQIIIDIGCADGYYAVGLALMFPKAKVYAYDIDNTVLELCKEVCRINNVENRVMLRNRIEKNDLFQFSNTIRGLLICDCEGYESLLFDANVAQHLSNFDLIIETHDYKDLEISTILKKVFAETHETSFIQSVGDIQKAKYYNFSELEGLSLDERLEILKENRPTTMEWLIAMKN